MFVFYLIMLIICPFVSGGEEIKIQSKNDTIKPYNTYRNSPSERKTKENNYKVLITFIANSETMGDSLNPSTMDYFLGKQYPHLSLIIPILKKNQKIKIEVIDWQEKDINLLEKNSLILGPIWGYTRNINQFMSFLNFIEKSNINMINDAKFIKWNLKKDYLIALREKKIDIPDTLIVNSKSSISFSKAVSNFYKKFGASDIILKGVIDAGGFGYLHVNKQNLSKAENHFNKLKSNNYGVVIQRFIPEIYKKGEFSFVFLRDKISHFYLKVPKYNEEKVQQFYGGKSFHFKNPLKGQINFIADQIKFIKNSFRNDLELTEKEVKEAYKQAKLTYSKILLLLDDLQIPYPKYLRIDGVLIKSKLYIMEIEGIEPYLEIKEAMDNDPSNNVINKYINSIIETPVEK